MRNIVLMASSGLALVTVAGCSRPAPEAEDRWEMQEAREAPPVSRPNDYNYGRVEGMAATPPRSEAMRSEAITTMDVSESPPAPGIMPTAAPGVAFNYRYAFRLPNNRIAAVQEQHAQACEKLTVAKCRITGMRYSLVDGDEVRAYLQFKLSPELAREFGKNGIAAVTAAEGMLVDSEISGNDEGTAINQSDVRSATIRSRIAEVERQLNRSAAGSGERMQLQAQLESLRRQLDSETQARTDSEEALANTPMAFHYGSGSTIPGFDGSSPLRDSWRASVSSFMTMLGVVLMGLGVSLPWLLLIGFLLLLWRTPPVRRLKSWLTGTKARTETYLDELAEHTGGASKHAAKEGPAN